MSDNITLVHIVNASDEPTIYTIIFVCIILLTGFLLLIIRTSESTTKFKFKNLLGFLKKKNVRRNLGLGIILFAVVVLFIESSTLREQFVAFAAIVATIISVISLNQSRKIKEESLEQERKENYRQYIKDLVDWTVQTQKYVTIPARLTQDLEEIAKNIVECRNELIVQKAKSIVIFSKAQEINDQLDSNIALLKTTIQKLNNTLVAFIQSLFKFYPNKRTPEVIDEIINKAGELTAELRNLLDVISKINI